MQLYDVFNGDADGLCSLHQMRLSVPGESRLITGVKRDIKLLSKLPSGAGSRLLVFDISFAKNRADAVRLLNDGAEIEYFDHHHAGDVPLHPRLVAHIDAAPDRGTSFIVDGLIKGKFRAWAVVGTFGDNFDETACEMAASLSISRGSLADLKELGILLNYNGYGTTVEDLFYHPAKLYQFIKDFTDPLDFISDSPVFTRLREGYESDMALVSEIRPQFSSIGNHVFMLPDKAWARRVSGVFANMLARKNPRSAHAVLTGLPGGGYIVSVRAPLADRRDAHTLCMKFSTGGGRKAAAGINVLPSDDLDVFIEEFQKTYTQG